MFWTDASILTKFNLFRWGLWTFSIMVQDYSGTRVTFLILKCGIPMVMAGKCLLMATSSLWCIPRSWPRWKSSTWIICIAQILSVLEQENVTASRQDLNVQNSVHALDMSVQMTLLTLNQTVMMKMIKSWYRISKLWPPLISLLYLVCTCTYTVFSLLKAIMIYYIIWRQRYIIHIPGLHGILRCQLSLCVNAWYSRLFYFTSCTSHCTDASLSRYGIW